MEIICFKIRGKFAHFRKYYANNTAFSFSIPPRTTLMGIVAAVLGLPKDSYYQKFSSENIHFGVRVLSRIKKSFHRLNFISLKSLGDISKDLSSDFRGRGGRIQTPFEIVSGWDIKKDELIYQVFISPTESGNDSFNIIKSHLLEKNPVFNITLGTANFSANIYDIEYLDKNKIFQNSSEDFVLIHSAIPTKLIQDLEFEKDMFEGFNFVEEDMMPGDFMDNENREVRKMNRLLFSISPYPVKIKTKDLFYTIKLNKEKINILFIDS